MTFKFEPWRERLRAAIVTSGLSRRALGLRAGLTEDYVRNIIAPSKGRSPSMPPIDKLHKIVTALDLTLEDLFEDGEFTADDIVEKMAHRGFARLFSEIKELSPREQLWFLDAFEQQMSLFEKMPAAKAITPAQLKLIRQENSDE